MPIASNREVDDQEQQQQRLLAPTSNGSNGNYYYSSATTNDTPTNETNGSFHTIVDDVSVNTDHQVNDDDGHDEKKNITFFAKLKQFLKFVGPAILISVGYVDPGNWATDIAGGATYQYKLLWVLVLSNAIALVLQSLAAKLGLVTGRDLAQQCANFYPSWCSFILWVLAELAIAATDLAEVLGTAIGLNLLFKLPLIWGVLLTAADTLLFLVFHHLGHRVMEFFIFVLMFIISVCFIVEMFYSKPVVSEVLLGLIPTLPPGSLAFATGILGATIMPHNIYLHSGIILTRRSSNVEQTKRNIVYAVLDGFFSLNVALFVNASILIVAGATFYSKESKPQVIQDAYVMLNRYFGKLAAVLFAVGLLCAGQSSTITGTLAGQIVMEGFVSCKMVPWLRRFATRLIAIVPAVIVIAATGDDGTYLLVWSQVVLSIQLPFAMIPLIRITGHASMGQFRNGWIVSILGWICVIIVVALNVWLLVDQIMSNVVGSAWWVWILVILSAILFLMFLIVTTFWPLRPKQHPCKEGAKEEKAHENVSVHFESESSSAGSLYNSAAL